VALDVGSLPHHVVAGAERVARVQLVEQRAALDGATAVALSVGANQQQRAFAALGAVAARSGKIQLQQLFGAVDVLDLGDGLVGEDEVEVMVGNVAALARWVADEQ